MNRRPLALPVAVCLLCVFTITGCAGDNKTIRWDQDKPAVTTSILDMKNEQQQLVEVNTQQHELIEVLTARVDQLEALNQQYQLQQAQIQALSARIDGLKLKKKYKPIRLPTPPPVKVNKTVETQRTTPVAPPQLTEAAAAVPVVDQAAQADAEKNAYTAAYLALKSGRYDEASNGFNKQLDKYPDGEYTDQAWYWLGETRLAQSDSSKALNAFKFVVDHYPDSVKHAAALFKMAQIAVEIKQSARAKEYYRRLIQEHADSGMAEQARAALNALEKPSTESGQYLIKGTAFEFMKFTIVSRVKAHWLA